MCSYESSFQPAQFLLLVGVPVASAVLLVQCLRWRCPRRLLGSCWKLESQEEPAPPPIPLPEDESSRAGLPATLQEVATFYQELHTPTQGQTILISSVIFWLFSSVFFSLHMLEILIVFLL